MILPISMSKPSGASAPGSWKPMPGWSIFTPIVMLPGVGQRRPSSLPAGKVGVFRDVYVGAVAELQSSSSPQRRATGARTPACCAWLCVFANLIVHSP